MADVMVDNNKPLSTEDLRDLVSSLCTEENLAAVDQALFPPRAECLQSKEKGEKVAADVCMQIARMHLWTSPPMPQRKQKVRKPQYASDIDMLKRNDWT